MSRYLIGVDLGTTNCAVACVDRTAPLRGGRPVVHRVAIPQLVHEGEVAAPETLPSFLYFPTGDEREAMWPPTDLFGAAPPDAVVGMYARDHGALVPGRQVSSAKSWLCNPAVDRTARILPWGHGEEDNACSPVEASARYLGHIRDAWNHAHTADDERFERQRIVLTVPASFDEEARELTVRAAQEAGLPDVILLEEPLAAFYAWIASHERSFRRRLRDGSTILICDVGGGTTDFTLVRARVEDEDLQFERTAIGEHLLLGGDNLDLALARRLQAKLGDVKLTLRQQQALARLVSSAKEQLLTDRARDRVTVAIPAAGRSMVGGRLAADLSRDEVLETLREGFLPLVAPDDLPARTTRAGLREFGLPYATDPAITKHLAAFLARAATADSHRLNVAADSHRFTQNTDQAADSRRFTQNTDQAADSHRFTQNTDQAADSRRFTQNTDQAADSHRVTHNTDQAADSRRFTQSALARPDAVLFNGGFFTPDVAREAIVLALESWFAPQDPDWRLEVLTNRDPAGAVAVGGAYYAFVREHGGIRVSGGSARAYYVAVRDDERRGDGRVTAVCVMPRGTEEGASIDLPQRAFTVATNRPVAFPLYSSTLGQDSAGDVVDLDEAEAHRHAPLVTILRYGKKSRHTELPVHLAARFTEVGTLEIWCHSDVSEHRWRLQFELRATEQPGDEEHGRPDAARRPDEDRPSDEAAVDDTGVVIAEDALTAALGVVRDVFGKDGVSTGGTAPYAVTPETLVGRLENLFGYARQAWPLSVIRRVADVLLECADGRRKGPRFEARWLNLAGFCLRPGFGATLDEWRMEQLRPIYLAGLSFPKEVQNHAEWLVLWQRVAGGLTAGQQQEIYQRYRTVLGIGGRKDAKRPNVQVEREGWRLLASLELLPASTRTALGDQMVRLLARQPDNPAFLWSLGRLGGRIPSYGPINTVVPASAASRWLEALLARPRLSAEAQSAIVQLCARTDDPHRDIGDDVRARAAARLAEAGAAHEDVERLRTFVPPVSADAIRMFGETLPAGLRLQDA